MRVGFGHAALVVGALMCSPAAPGHAMTTAGEIDSGTTPPWLAVIEPYQPPLPTLDSALLPPQFERVLLLDLDGRSGKSDDAALDALFARGPAGGGDRRPSTTTPALHPERLAALAALLIAGAFGARRLVRRRRLARRASGA